jgi:hypothetical protein
MSEMKLKTLIAAPLVALLVTALAATPDKLPDGWLRDGTASQCLSTTEAATGAPTASVFLLDCSASKDGFATLMQSIAAQDYAGKRVRLTALVQGDGLAGWGGLWLRGDVGQQGGRVFDNMYQRPLTGSFGWHEASVVLHIPKEVDSLHFGFLLTGTGKLRATQFRLEQVADSVAETGGPLAGGLLSKQIRNASPQ